MSAQSQVRKFNAVVLENLPEMTKDVMQGWIENPSGLQKALRSALVPSQDGNEPKEVQQPLLTKRAAVRVEGAKRFVADETSLKEANVGWTGVNFDQFFLGKVEENVEDTILAIHCLEKRSLDAPIRKELGQNREEIALTHFFDLLKKQSKGQKEHLLVNGCANIAYIRDKNGTLWAVRARWDSDRRCWDVRAPSVEDPRGWDDGRLVLSRDC